MKNKKRIFSWAIAVGVALTGAVIVGCSSMDLDSGGSSGGYAPSPAPAAPC